MMREVLVKHCAAGTAAAAAVIPGIVMLLKLMLLCWQCLNQEWQVPVEELIPVSVSVSFLLLLLLHAAETLDKLRTIGNNTVKLLL